MSVDINPMTRIVSKLVVTSVKNHRTFAYTGDIGLSQSELTLEQGFHADVNITQVVIGLRSRAITVATLTIMPSPTATGPDSSVITITQK